MSNIIPLISSGTAGPLGVLHLPRLWQKASLGAAGKLHADYPSCGQGYDQMVIDALGLDRAAVIDYITAERYGVAEHHVRQIHNGLKGWFDGDPARLFPLEPAERASRLIEGFGGRSVVRTQATAAIQKDDLRWAIELASWLVAAPADKADELQPDR